MEKKARDRIRDVIFEIQVSVICVKNYLNSLMRIRIGGNLFNSGSGIENGPGIRDQHPVSATLGLDNISWRIQYKMSELNDTMYKGQVTVNKYGKGGDLEREGDEEGGGE